MYELFLDKLYGEDIFSPEKQKVDSRTKFMMLLGAQINTQVFSYVRWPYNILQLKATDCSAMKVFRSIVYSVCKKKE